MQRTYLNLGDTLELNNKIYTVKTVLGDGATCVVYSAEYKDNNGHSHKVNIKECYPYNASVSREGSHLNWTLSDEQEQSLKAFEFTYKNLNEWQEGIANVSVYDICDANNTKYIIMEHNKDCVTFDKDNPESLSDILKTVRLLAHYVGKYHQNGYLHLDVKPSNFLVYPRPSDHIVLFDLDTVTAISDIETAKYRSASYSDGWAAPEQKQGKIYKLCPATDIFAIGAVLFEKIMGRQVNNDDIGYFSEWDFYSELFENINPKIKRLLTNIFKKTLAASVKRRYQTAEALVKDLDKAIKIAESEVYLKGEDVCCSGFFIGRESELKCIKESFDNNKKAVFLHGFGGIGKTEIARKYAELYKKDYDVVLFVKYDNNSTLQEKLDEIDIINFDGDTIEHRKKLRILLDDKTLVIVDNFDVEIGTDNGLKYLLDTKAHILVSTRTDFSSVYSGDKYTQIEITELASAELEQVFFSNAKIGHLSDTDKNILYKIFKLIENHTYATELLAKQMYYSHWTLATLFEKVKSGFASLEYVEKVVTNKDDDTKKDNTLNILRAIYRISDLSEGQKQVLRNMTILDFVQINKNSYREITCSNNLNDFNTMIETGYIQREQYYYVLHTLIKQLIKSDMVIDWNNCIDIYNYIYREIKDYSKYFNTVGMGQFFEAIQKGDFIDCFIRRCDMTLKENLILAKLWYKNLLHCEKEIIQHFVAKESNVINNILNIIDTESEKDISVCLQSLLFLKEFYINKESKKTINKFKALLSSIKSLHDKNEYLVIVCSCVDAETICSETPKEILTQLYDLCPESFHLTWYQKNAYGFTLNESDVVCMQEANERRIESERNAVNWELQFEEINQPYSENTKDPEDWYDSDEAKLFYEISYDIDEEKKDTMEDSCRILDDYDNYIAFNTDYSDFDYLDDYYDDEDDDCALWSLFDDCLPAENELFRDYVLNNFDEKILSEIHYIGRSNLERTKILINFAHTILCGFDLKNEQRISDYPDWENIICDIINFMNVCFSENKLFKNDECDAIKEYVHMLNCVKFLIKKSDKKYLNELSKIKSTQTERYSDDIEYTLQIRYLIKISKYFKKSYLCIPCMVETITELIPNKRTDDFNNDVYSYFPLFKLLSDTVQNAFNEIDENETLKSQFLNVRKWCENWMNGITNKKFDLKPDAE